MEPKRPCHRLAQPSYSGRLRDCFLILKKIGPRDALPSLIEAMGKIDRETAQKLLAVFRKIDRRGGRPKAVDDLAGWITWYEEEYGRWPW